MAHFTLKPAPDQVVVVFGASSGIGRATALRFARAGARLAVVGRTEDALTSLVNEINSMGTEAISILADTSHFDEVKTVADRAVQHFGRIDTWAHIAGVGMYAKFWELTPEEFRQVVDVNLLGQVYGAMAALPYLRRQGGSLIHVSSVESQIGLPFQSAYAASKHGMKGFLDVLRLELEHEEIPVSVTNIMPATINTPFFSNAKTKLGVQPRAVPPVYEPEEVAAAIVYAASHPARDVIVGRAGYMMIWSKRLVPWLMDRILLRTAFKNQLTRQRKASTAPSTLFRAETRDARIHGGWKAKSA